jgi:hypothetical protein
MLGTYKSTKVRMIFTEISCSNFTIPILITLNTKFIITEILIVPRSNYSARPAVALICHTVAKSRLVEWEKGKKLMKHMTRLFFMVSISCSPRYVLRGFTILMDPKLNTPLNPNPNSNPTPNATLTLSFTLEGSSTVYKVRHLWLIANIT